ncbi:MULTISPECIES: FAD/NAD(P)-binding protein [unclassified Pseudomonas]|uniref:FAD/NAD(P)-binding protein n=1 Tax=unclassified Pseudomonas TaxID=196821 RepID=UPI0024473D19|nr:MULTISPECIES: FAD/NAD(P)-binding protein [unclassified Pseudomonas]MDG9930827.1 FAD/NAD(P)-binding protein [Pseudomonas sp. GD04042]MDH0484149.1 FAD/NAD(P)-binding protein [Pseudomonas sp. GD04015]MDH0606734.1 FAD/NAD(P)-binding protein [Pseudomonas sp. GD03869]
MPQDTDRLLTTTLPITGEVPTQRIGIIGSGFCGTALAIHLLQKADRPLHVRLLNRTGQLARGLAYGTRSASHVLNVPAERMSLFTDKPGDFLDFARHELPEAKPGDFLPRRLYGDYLQRRLDQAIANRAPTVTFECEQAHVVDLVREDDRYLLRLDDGRSITSDKVVIATGNFTPATPGALRELIGDPRYIADPWCHAALDGIATDARVLLLGTGLTMYDMALALQDRGHQGPMLAMSRRALLPHGHRDNAEHPRLPQLPANLKAKGSARQLLSRVRTFVRNAEADGFDWRDAIAALRPVTPALWQMLDAREQRRFLCHLQAYWDIHRHRAAPFIAGRVERLLQGQLRVQPARLVAVDGAADCLNLQVRPRGSSSPRPLVVDHIINCTGPCNDLRNLDEPMLNALQARGEVVQDDNRIGLNVDDDYHLLNTEGHPQSGLYLLSPMLRARYWESTAVPELRQHAERLALQLLR